jgi:hypothetical protein
MDGHAVVSVATSLVAAALTFILQGSPSQATANESKWTRIEPKDAGFSIELPGTVTENPPPGQYSSMSGVGFFLVQVIPLDAFTRATATGGDRKAIASLLESMRDGSIHNIKGTLRTSSSEPFDGRPSILASFDGTPQDTLMAATERLVLNEGCVYLIVAVGAKSEMRQADVDRFIRGFHLVHPEIPAAVGLLRAVRYDDVVCSRLPAMPLAFDMPVDFAARAVGKSAEAGCLWGVEEDLNRVTAKPDEGDFTTLRRGVFRARMSTNVICSEETGGFDQMDGTGEAGIRRSLAGTGAKVIVWKKETIAGLPALQIVADVAGGRVYMLYLGKVHSPSNTLLVNYYPPVKRAAADDALWARFVAGITRAEGTGATGARK